MARFWLCDVCETEGVDLDAINYMDVEMLITVEDQTEQLIHIHREICSKNCAVQVQLAIERAIHTVCNEGVEK